MQPHLKNGYNSQTPARESIPLEELGITPYKQKLLRMRIDGYTPRQIAHLESVTEKTVHNHLAQIFQKHDANNLIDFVIKVGWLRIIPKQS